MFIVLYNISIAISISSLVTVKWGLNLTEQSPEDKKIEKLKDTLNTLGQKSAGKGGWSKGEQEKYNKTWIELRKLLDHPPKGAKPSVFKEPGMSVYKHADLVKALHKKLGIEDWKLLRNYVEN